MKHGFFLFPAGLTGAALLSLRASIALLLVVVTFATQASPVISSATIILAIGISIGFCTRVAAFLAIAMAAMQGQWAAPVLFLAHSLNAAALVMAGPGALSIDAWRFGRRTIHFPDPAS